VVARDIGDLAGELPDLTVVQADDRKVTGEAGKERLQVTADPPLPLNVPDRRVLRPGVEREGLEPLQRGRCRRIEIAREAADDNGRVGRNVYAGLTCLIAMKPLAASPSAMS